MGGECNTFKEEEEEKENRNAQIMSKMKLRGVRWSKFVTRMGRMISKYEIFIRMREGKNRSEDLDVDGGYYIICESNGM